MINGFSVAVVILNWNGAKHLAEYLPSVVQHSSNADIIVADNGSTDNSKSVVDKYPNVKWLKLEKNYGFTGGYNKALEQIKADIFVLINSDVRVTKNWLVAPTLLFKNNPLAAVTQPKILADANKDYFEYAGASGGFIDTLGYPYCRGRIFDTVEADLNQYDTEIPVHWSTGACMFIRSTVWKKSGGFDEDFFAHMEEIDLCWRVRNMGFECYISPESTVYHLGGGTLNYNSPRKVFLNFRNSLFTIIKNDRSGKLGLKIFSRLILDGVAGIKFIFEGNPSFTLAIIKAHFSFYGKLLNKLSLRKQLLKTDFDNPNQKVPHTISSILISYMIKGRKRFSDL